MLISTKSQEMIQMRDSIKMHYNHKVHIDIFLNIRNLLCSNVSK